MFKRKLMYKNAISNMGTKEMLCDTALSVLLNMHFMTPDDMPHVKVEFGYLLVDTSGTIFTMFKVTIAQELALLKPKTYYFGADRGGLHLLDGTITEQSFIQIKQDMRKMHPEIDFEANQDAYFMELRKD